MITASMFDTMFTIMPVISIGMFVLVFVLIFSVIIRNIKQERKNDRAPRLTVEAMIVSKRDQMHRHRHHPGDAMAHTSYTTTYYATFEFASGDRIELPVPAADIGLLVEGDRGDLTFQGTRFISFVRK